MSGIISDVRLCDSCKNCVKLNEKKQTVKTKHFTGIEYDNESFNEEICSITATGLRNVTGCSHYLKK